MASVALSALAKRVDALAKAVQKPLVASSVTILAGEPMPDDVPGILIVRVLTAPDGASEDYRV